MTEREVPEPLRYARLPGRHEAARVSDALRISYPPDGAELDLGIGARGSGVGRSQPLVVKLKGGSTPFSVLVNGTPLAEKASRHQLVWQPDAPGYLNVTILDANGESAGITVFLR